MTAETHKQNSAGMLEIEGKYPVDDFDAVRDALRDAGAVFCGSAVEHDTFYDHADGRMAAAGAVCRLRRFEILDDADPPMDPRALLTYKGAVLRGAVLDAESGAAIAANVLAPAVFGWATVSWVWALFRKEIRLLALPQLSGHVVICGLGGRGMELLRCFAQEGRKVVAIEKTAHDRS